MSEMKELKQELNKLDKEYEQCRNEIDKAVIVCKIEQVKAKMDSIKYPAQEKKVVSQNTNAPVMDHKEAKNSGRGTILNSGNTFITTL